MSASRSQPPPGQGGLFDVARPAKVVAPRTGEVEVRRSARRRRTVSAYRDGDRTIVLIPARMSRADEREWVAVMVRRLEAQDRRRRPSDAALLARARRLSAEHLAGQVRPSSVRWVTNQASRWGSCTPGDGTVRLSHRLQGMPGWVVDYVLVHELVHLVEATHSERFWSLVEAYPLAERARGYLEGISAAADARTAPTEAGEAPDPFTSDHCTSPEGGWEAADRSVDGTVRPSARR